MATFCWGSMLESKPTKPSVPYCVNEWSNTHTFCDDWTINSYNRDVENYRFYESLKSKVINENYNIMWMRHKDF